MIWEKIKAISLHSLTVAAAYVSLGASAILNNLDGIAAALGDPEFNNQVSSLIGHDPKVAAFYAKAYGIVMIVTRLRSKIFKGN